MKVSKSNKDINAIFDGATTVLELNDIAIRSLNLVEIAEKLSKKTDVKELHLTKNKLGTLELHSLCEAIAGLPQLEILNFSKNHVSVNGLTYITKILKKAEKLKELNLAHNLLNLANKDIHDFSDFTKAIAAHSTLENLDLSNNKLTNDKLTVSFIKRVAGHPTLKILNLGGNSLGAYEAQLIGQNLAKNRTLTSLSLAYNQDESSKPLGFYGRKYSIFIEPIFLALKENTSLERLDLTGIRLRISEYKLLEKVLENNTTLLCIKWDTNPHKGEEESKEQVAQLCKKIQAALDRNVQFQSKDNGHLDKMKEINLSNLSRTT